MDNKDILSCIFNEIPVFDLLRYRTINKKWNACIVNDSRWAKKTREIKKYISRFLVGKLYVSSWEHYSPFHTYIRYSLRNIINSNDDEIISTLIKNHELFAVVCRISDIDESFHSPRTNKRKRPWHDARQKQCENTQTFWIPKKKNCVCVFNNANVQIVQQPKEFIQKYNSISRGE